MPRETPMEAPDARVDVVDTQDLFAIDEDALRRMIEAVLDRYELGGGVNVVLLDDARIHELNRRFLDHDWPTDVLTFEGQTAPDGTVISGGEILVSVETALREAAERGADAWREIVLYVVHGLLHLAGFDDRDEDSATLMHDETRVVLADLGFDVEGLGLVGESESDRDSAEAER